MLDEELSGFFSGVGACCFWCLHAANSIVNWLVRVWCGVCGLLFGNCIVDASI